MKINIRNYKNDVDFIEVENEVGLKMVLCSFGASVRSLEYDNVSLLQTPVDDDIFLYTSAYYGKTLGRVAGRIVSEGTIDGHKYNLDITDGNFLLHGGKSNWSYTNFKYKIKEYKNKTSIVFQIKETKKNGLFGTVKGYITYEISRNNPKFRIVQKASTNTHSFINLSNHIYWNFSTPTVNDYSLKMPCDLVCAVDDTLLIDHIEEVLWHFDYRTMSKLGPRLKFIDKNEKVGTIDNTFIFNKDVNNKPHKVVLKNKDYTLNLSTSYPAMNIYIDNTMNDTKFTNFDVHERFSGIALEPQLLLPDLNSIYFKKGDKYNHFIEYSIKRNG